MPGDFRISITDAPGRDAYPMASYTWLLTTGAHSGSGEKAHHRGFPSVDGSTWAAYGGRSWIRAVARRGGGEGIKGLRQDSIESRSAGPCAFCRDLRQFAHLDERDQPRATN